MDGREEGMPYPQGPVSYYLNRGYGPGSSGPGSSIRRAITGIHAHPIPVFKNLSNLNISAELNVGASGGGSAGGPSFHSENPSSNFSHGPNTTIVHDRGPPGSEPVKRKRGRPRKYAPDGANVSLGLSPLSASKNSSGGMSSGEKKPKGRPRGSGWKQKLAPLGEWMNTSAGMAFTPHVLRVGIGEDIASKILAFAQQRSRALCIMSAYGSVSAITLRQPTASGATITYEGRFEILCLSGSYLVAESDGPRSRTGGISISVCSPDGQIIGGAIGGKLPAASPVQVVACSFIHGNAKPTKNNADSIMEDDEKHPLLDQSTDTTPVSLVYVPSSGLSVWPPMVSRAEVKNTQTDIDLMRG